MTVDFWIINITTFVLKRMLLCDSGLYSRVGLKLWSLVASAAPCTLLEMQILRSTPGLAVGSKRIGVKARQSALTGFTLLWEGQAFIVHYYLLKKICISFVWYSLLFLYVIFLEKLLMIIVHLLSNLLWL